MVVPAKQLVGRDLLRQWPRRMPAQRLLQRDVEVVVTSRASMISAQRSQHVAVVAGGENSVKDDVVAVVEVVANGLVGESDIDAVLDVVFSTSRQLPRPCSRPRAPAPT